MTQTRFDQAARRVARLDPVSFFTWLLTGFAKYLRFRRWLDTRTTPGVEEESEQTGDTVAELEAVDAPAPPWLFPQEFQTEPDADRRKDQRNQPAVNLDRVIEDEKLIFGHPQGGDEQSAAGPV